MSDLISRRSAIDAMNEVYCHIKMIKKRPVNKTEQAIYLDMIGAVKSVPSAPPEDYTELKREFILMASYIDVLLECSDVQKETLMGFISRLAEFMPWTERD